MKSVKTTILGDAVYMRIADHHDPEETEYWMEFQVPLDDLMLPTAAGEESLGDSERRSLGEIQTAALRYAREQLAEEAHTLAARAGIAKKK